MDNTKQLQAKAIIHIALGDIIEYTVNWLAPLFGSIEKEQLLPWAILLNRATSYHHYTFNTITFREDHLKNTNYYLGHEVGHHLHHIVNPETSNRYTEDYEHANLGELVAEYGGLIFSSYDHPGVEQNKLIIFNELPHDPTPVMAMTDEEKTFFKREQYEVHEGGISAANFLFRRYDTAYLQDFAHANVETAQKLLQKLGWHRPLFVPYEDRNKEYVYDAVEENEFGIKEKVRVIVGGTITDIYTPEVKELE